MRWQPEIPRSVACRRGPVGAPDAQVGDVVIPMRNAATVDDEVVVLAVDADRALESHTPFGEPGRPRPAMWVWWWGAMAKVLDGFAISCNRLTRRRAWP